VCNDRQTGCGIERSDVEVSGSVYNRKWYVIVKEMYEVIVEGIYTVSVRNVWWKEYIQ
jgi:hypothetical protein